MTYDVPFTSQYEGLIDPEWRWRGCGIVALKMIMDFWHARSVTNRTAPVRELLGIGLDLEAYREGIGWTHGGLADVARRYGYRAYNRDFAPQGPSPLTVGEALEEMRIALGHGPVMASVFSGLDPERGGGHIVVVTSMNDDLVTFMDPEQNTQREGRRILALRTFRDAFKRRYICVLPGN